MGSGGVGAAFAPIAARRDFYEHIVFADIDERRAPRVVDRSGRRQVLRREGWTPPTPADVAAVAKANGVRRDPQRRGPAVRARASSAAHSTPAPPTWTWRCRSRHPHPGAAVRAGRARSSATRSSRWRTSGRTRGQLALVRVRRRAGLLRRRRAVRGRPLFSEVDEVGVRDGANLEIAGYAFAPTFSIWTTIEECLNPPVIWETRPRLVHDPAVQRARDVPVPGGDRRRRVRERRARGGAARSRAGSTATRVTFKYGLGDEFIGVLETLHKLGLDRTDPVSVRGVRGQPARRGGGGACPTRRSWARG